MSSRRKILKIPPLAVVRCSLVVNPVTSAAQPDAVSFADVLVQAVNAPRSIWASIDHQGEMQVSAPISASVRKEAQAAAAQVTGWTPQQNYSVDLYEQLDGLLREKSILIAVV